MNSPGHRHLNPDQIQDLLDERLPRAEREGVQVHLEGCSRCRDEVRAWRRIFARLEEVDHFAPGPDFADRVLDQVPTRRSVGARLTGWVRRLVEGFRPQEGHLDTADLLDRLDGALPAFRRRRVDGHLEACPRCRTTMEGWRALFAELDGLGRLAPAEGFADAVMARVKSSAPAAEPAASTPEAAAGWMERLRPRGRRAWTLAGGALAAPAVAVVAVALAIFSHPLLTPSNLATFVWWRLTALARTGATLAIGAVADSTLMHGLWESTQALAAVPLAVGAGAAAFSVATLLALWTLRRHLLTNSAARGHHAKRST